MVIILVYCCLNPSVIFIPFACTHLEGLDYILLCIQWPIDITPGNVHLV